MLLDDSIKFLAETAGTSEPALRLLVSVLVSYPLAFVYRILIYPNKPIFSHLYFAATGLSLCLFNYGFEAYHSAVAVLVTYVLMHVLYRTRYLVIVNFTFHMSYLLIGYYFTESNDYDIKWTMPHCVLVLRLIGLGFDVSDGDGRVPHEDLSKDKKDAALSEIPPLLQIAAFSYFPASCLVGPQFPFSRYSRFTNKAFEQYTGHIRAGLTRGGLGLIYLLIWQIGAMFFPDNYFFTKEFVQISYLRKIFVLAMWGKVALYKYISCWLLAEGGATCFGLTFVSVDKNNTEDWSGCSNVKLKVFETASKLGHFVASFNVNTNTWVANYVYKRLRFLGNRTLSYASALIFLAVWHGFHSGYYMSFLLEYFVITFERQCTSVFDALCGKFGILNSSYVKAVIFVIRKAYTQINMGWCLLPFVLLSYERWIQIYGLYYYLGYIFLGTWFIVYFISSMLFSTKTKKN